MDALALSLASHLGIPLIVHFFCVGICHDIRLIQKSRMREIKRFREFFGVFCKFFRLFCEKVGIIANIDKILKNFVKYIAFPINICYNNRKDFIGRLHTYFYVPTVLSSCMFILKGVFTRNEKRFERKSDCFGIH